jgi:hypothetical protein
MTTGRWLFRTSEQGLELYPPSDVNPAAEVPLWDFATSDIGNSIESLHSYRKIWESATKEPERASSGIAGNATSQRLEGAEVVLEASYDQWPTVRISREQFEAFLDQFAEFLNTSGQR